MQTQRGTTSIEFDINIANEVCILETRHGVVETSLLLVLSDVRVFPSATE
jgi:hypothetical protein